MLSKHLSVITHPFSRDNFAFSAGSADSHVAFLVDPGERGVAESVLKSAEKEGWKITQWCILVTHGHPDHVGGLAEALSLLPHARVVHDEGRPLPALDSISPDRRLLLPLDETRPIEGTRLTLRALATPFHTDHCRSYLLHEPQQHCPPAPSAEPATSDADAPSVVPGALFTGDSLFSGGAGRFPQLQARTALSSLDRISELPDDTAVFCGHEYSVTNWQFARTLEPDNGRLEEAETRAIGRRAKNLPTIPVRLADERENNPFLRARERSLAKRLGFLEPDPVAVLAEVRSRKDAFA